LSNLFAENPAYQSKSSTYLELIKNWFNPQSDTVVTEVIEEPFVSPNKSQTSNSSWWSNLVGEKTVVAEKPGFFARIANRLLGQDSSSTTNYGALAQMLMGGKSNNQPVDSFLNNYLESAKKPGVLENMFKQTKDLMQNNPELVNKVQDYLMSNPQVFEKMGQILKDNPGLVNSLL
jgi:hypothetical protein